MPLAALTRVDIANYVSALFTVYILLIFVYILLNMMFSLGLRPPYSRWTDAIMNFLRDVCEPYLKIFRRRWATIILISAAFYYEKAADHRSAAEIH